MKFRFGSIGQRYQQRLAIGIAILLVTAAALMVSSTSRTEAATGPKATATYTRGSLNVTVPYAGARPGSGKLILEVLDPEDAVLGRVERPETIAAGEGHWQTEVKLAKAMALDDLVWNRLRYRFVYADRKEPAVEGIESISNVLRTPVVHVFAQQSYWSGAPAAVRIIAADSKNELIAGPGTVRIEFGEKHQVLYQSALNRHGTTEAQFRFPAGIVGNHGVRYIVETPIGSTEVTQLVRLQNKASILLTTEKPLYQPNQTIHVRALALYRASREAAANRKLTFELEDSRGNKVFKKVTQTDKFGVASTEFPLADEVNLGTYHLRGLMDEPDSGNSAEIAVNVEKYVLPKFKVAVEFTGKGQHGYRPGDHVVGVVRANYFFGKPVEGEVVVKATGMDVAQFEAASVKGKTDAEGAYRFDLKLPAYFAGKALNQGAARVLVEAMVKDTAAHNETRGEPITVSESPLIITAVPEGGTMVPGLENQVFVLTSYADGKPASTSIRVQADGNAEQTATTDEGGIAVVRLKAGAASIRVEAKDKEGSRVTSTIPLQTRDGSDQVLLRGERAVYRAGDRMQFRIFSTKRRGSAYVDVIKDGQTVQTRDLDIVNGQASFELTATPDLAGTVDVNAYLFGSDARPVADHRLVFVQPADELKIEAASDAPVYKPGSEARVRFRVTNSRGQGVQAVLGLQVVDEAVFALAEKMPGFAKVFFYLEQEVMKPRYEIHSVGMPEIVTQADEPKREQRDRAAQALFSATELVNKNSFVTEAGRSVPMTKYGEYTNRYRTRFLAQIREMSPVLNEALSRNHGDLTKVKAQDSWNNDLRIERMRWGNQRNQYLVRSAGMDKRFDSYDDLGTFVEVKTRKAPQPGKGTIEVDMEHNRGPFNSRAEIMGTVMDQSGSGVEAATITARDTSTGATRVARSSADGRFSISAVNAGEYEIEAVFDSEKVTKKVTLAARDRAVLKVGFEVKSFDQVVLMDVAPMQLALARQGFAGNGVVGGVPGGAPGGVMGGIVGGVGGAPPPPPMMMEQRMMAETVSVRADAMVVNSPQAKDKAAEPGARVRSYFPEALYINPAIITNQNGEASVVIPMADSITTWRMAMIASTQKGALGSGTSSLKVFQDFFVDLDLPVTLTQGDRVSIPVAAYNYSGANGQISLQLKPADWYSLVEDSANKTVAVDSGRIGGSQFTIEAKRIGKFKLTLAANMPGRADIVVREIEVIPNGREQNQVFNGRLESSVMHEVVFPANAIPDAGKVFVRLYPGPLSQVVEGMDAILRMPGGCFEQTSSSTYPNILALDYMKRSKKLTPEVHAKAEGFITNGYQRLLTFEVAGGGFSWFGEAPANKILTSYGLMEFYDMSKVHEVDPSLIQRTQQWLASQQKPDGSWGPDKSFINEGATNRYNSDVLRITAYIAWALGETKYQGPAVEQAKRYIESHLDAKLDTYTLAVLANFASSYGKDREFTRRAMGMLLDARTEKDDKAWWTAEETSVYATGESATVETTGLAVQALLKSGQASETARKALAYLASKKDASGTWGTTQATIMALRALLLSMDNGTADVRGTVEVTLNGKPVERLTLTPDNNDLFHQFVLKNVASSGSNQVGLRFEGKGGLAYQIVGRSFLPWSERPAREALSIDVAYDRTRLAQDDLATSTATVKNNLNKSANMVMIDLGIPPGFDLLSEDLQAMQEKTAGQKGGKLEKFSQTATQAILYFDSIPAGGTVTVKYRLRAKYPIRAKTMLSRVYEYYDPAVSSVANPVQLEVRKK